VSAPIVAPPDLRHRPTWGFQTGLWQPRKPAFWLFLVLLLLSGVALAYEQLAYIAFSPVGWALSWVLLSLYIIPVVVITRRLDLYEREPRSLVVGAFLWGGVIALVFSSIGNVVWAEVISQVAGPEFAAQWGAALTAPVIEEIYKYLGLVVIYLIARREIDDLMDGVVFGAMIGLGFSVFEDVYYFMDTFGGSVGGVLEGFWVRVIVSGLYGHVLYTAIAGVGFAYFVVHRGDEPFGKRLLVASSLLLTAIAAHFFWNSPWFWSELPIIVATTIKGVPFLIFLALALQFAWRREHRWLGIALEREVGQPGLDAAELRTLADPRSRRRLRKAVRKAAGKEAERILKQLHREQINLAMVATRVTEPDHPDLALQRGVCASLREALLRIPNARETVGATVPGGQEVAKP
jgi:RsiW-degrading membrane proteinase PrsW (M82 family)